MTIDRFDAVVLAGGTAERLGGASKADLCVGGRRLLDLVLAVVDRLRAGGPGCDVVVAPASVSVPAGALRTMEEPPGSGPSAGIDAGLAVLPPAGPRDVVVVCAVDSPGIGQWAPALLRALVRSRDAMGAVALGGAPEPQRQYLQAIYRRGALEAVLRATGVLRDRPVRGVLAPLRPIDVPVDAQACRDLDTCEDLEWWRAHWRA